MSNNKIEEIKKIVKLLPENPGVYQFFDKDKTIIYVGKAKNLKKRVGSYFKKNIDNAKTKVLVNKIDDIKHLVVETEIDALLLENNLIKKYQPRYNILLKDNKSYPWICVKNENFPRVFYTRNFIKDGSKYYGPYTSMNLVKTIINFIRNIFKLRTCSYNLSEKNINSNKFTVCLEYHINNCKAPCVAKQSKNEYDEIVKSINNILKGNVNKVINLLKVKMLEYSTKLEFEQAEDIKKKLELLENYKSKSTIVSPIISNVDVFSIIEDDKFAYINYLKVVSGAIVGVHTFEIKKKLNEDKLYMLVIGITEIRTKFKSNAKEIIIPFEIENYFEHLKISIPKIGDKKKLLELSEKNAKYYRLDKLKQQQAVDPQKHTKRILERIKTDLRLSKQPVHIECFDNSNLQGTNPVAACVVFIDAKPSKKDYRHFNIKTVVGIDDFASMKEIVYRRYKRLLDEKKELPQLIVVDGGKGQLSSAFESLKELKIENKIAIIGIAKRLEEIFFPHDSIPLYLDKNSETLKVIQNLRNEAHRFGITFHRKKRSNNFINSELNNIDGVGEKTIESLIKKFKSVNNIKKAKIDDLAKIVGKARANLIFDYFNKKKLQN